jgi:hypothetical protein
MHLLYLGGTNWILKQIVLGPDLLAPRQADAEKPIDIYNAALAFDLWLPFSAGARFPPKVSLSFNPPFQSEETKLVSVDWPDQHTYQGRPA